jgi:hypothetical protein
MLVFDNGGGVGFESVGLAWLEEADAVSTGFWGCEVGNGVARWCIGLLIIGFCLPASLSLGEFGVLECVDETVSIVDFFWGVRTGTARACGQNCWAWLRRCVCILSRRGGFHLLMGAVMGW